MSDDIVARLYSADASENMDADHSFDGLLMDAALEIETLREYVKELETRLRAAALLMKMDEEVVIGSR